MECCLKNIKVSADRNSTGTCMVTKRMSVWANQNKQARRIAVITLDNNQTITFITDDGELAAIATRWLPSLPWLLMITILMVSTQLLERRKYKTPLLLSYFDRDPTYDVLKVTAKSRYSKARHNPDAAYFCNARKASFMLLWLLSLHQSAHSKVVHSKVLKCS